MNYAKKTLDVAHWKWEFLRRNKQYKVDYESKCSDRGNPSSQVFDFFKQKYGISFPVNPSQAIPQKHYGFLVEVFSLTPCSWHYPVEKILLDELERITQPAERQAARLQVLSQKKSVAKKSLKIVDEIDVRVRLDYSITRLMREFRRIVVELQKGRKARRRLRTKGKFGEYKEYLRIYDLKQANPTLDWKHILAKKDKCMLGEVTSKKIDTAIKQFQAAGKIVDGGYRSISV